MSYDILSGPDRGPPAFDWRKKTEQLEGELTQTKARIARMQEALLQLDEGGGLGHEKHEAIKKALGLPSGKFCTSPRACLLKDRCESNARGFACND